jgi:hypothetical protein
LGNYIDNLKFIPDIKDGGTCVLTGFPGALLKPLVDEFEENFFNLLKTLNDEAVQDDLYIFRNGIGCAKKVYVKDRNLIDWNIVERLHKTESATVYLRACQRYFPVIKQISRKIEQHLNGTQIFVNLFATPPNSVGLRPHLDPTEFFVLQIAGSKIWHFWRQPTLNELTSMSLEERANFAKAIADNEEESLVVEIRAGQVMYVPRFKIHAPITEASGSVHLTVGIATPDMQKLYD